MCKKFMKIEKMEFERLKEIFEEEKLHGANCKIIYQICGKRIDVKVLTMSW